MASVSRRGKKWRAEVYRDGRRDSKTFITKAEASAWALSREAELTGRALEQHTWKEALEKYALEVSPSKPGSRWEIVRCRLLARDSMASKLVGKLTATDISDWRDRRLKEVAPASVLREMNLMRSVLEIARKEWAWLRENPMRDVKRPIAPASRKRRVTDKEIERVTLALGYIDGEPQNLSQRIALAFLFALETAMRSGEIVGLTWGNVLEKSVVLPRTKNGDRREVPLSQRAREILKLLPKGDGPVFGLGSAQRDALWRKARDRAKLLDLHFHDSRAEAIWRLSKKLDVLELARVIGHRDLKSLTLYYNASADELADKLG